MNEWRECELGPEFNAKLAALCDERNINLTALSRALHMNPECLGRVLTARHILTRHMYLRIRCEIDWLTKEGTDAGNVDQPDAATWEEVLGDAAYPGVQQAHGGDGAEVPGAVVGIPGDGAVPVLPGEEGETTAEEGEQA